jgi:hypothetical protein
MVYCPASLGSRVEKITPPTMTGRQHHLATEGDEP